MRITVNGVEIDVPEDAAVDIVRGDDGKFSVFIDDVDEDLGGFIPGQTLVDMFTSRNAILSEIESTQCDCDECAAARKGAKTANELSGSQDRGEDVLNQMFAYATETPFSRRRAKIVGVIAKTLHETLTPGQVDAIFNAAAAAPRMSLVVGIESAQLEEGA